MPLEAIDAPPNQKAHRHIQRLDRRLASWVRKRPVFVVLIALGLTLIAVNEKTYHDTRASLARSVTFTESRVGARELFYLLTRAEAAQFGFLATGLPLYLTQFADAEAALPKAQAEAVELLAGDANAPLIKARMTRVSGERLAQISHTLALARSGALAAALQMATADAQKTDVEALRVEVQSRLATAARLQQQHRESIFQSLLISRIAVGGLTLLALASLFLFRRQLQAQDRERLRQRSAMIAERGQLEREVKRRTGQLTELTRHFQDTREEERAVVARQLHDDLGGVLTASAMEIARARTKVTDPAEILLRLDRVSEHLKNGIELKRRIIEELRPSALTHLGLGIALQNICDDTSAGSSISVHLSLGDLILQADAELAVYRLVQESLTNVTRHAKATQASVRIKLDDSGQVVIEVQDDGIGFDPAGSQSAGHGLASMRFRVESLGGKLHIKSDHGIGTTVRIAFPLIEFEPSLF